MQSAQALMSTGELDQAAKLFREMLDKWPDLPGAWDGLGMIAHQRKDMKAARSCFERAVQLNPKSGMSWLHLGVACRAMGEPKSAAEHYRRAAKLDPDLPGLFGNYGNALRDAGRYPEAIQAYKRALKQNPNAPVNLVNLALGLQSNKQFAEAAELLEKAVELDPDNANTRKELGNVLLELNRYDEGIACYRKAIEMNPQDHTAFHNLATAFQNLGRLEDAADAYRQALAIRPDFFGSLRQFASVKKFDSNDEEISAIEAGLKAKNINDDERVDLYFALAKAYDDSEQYDKAFRQLQSANQLYRRTLDYHSDKNRAFVNRVIRVFDQRFFEARRDFGVGSTRPVFIVGMPRSGTTLTEQIIASHPDVYGAGELMKMHYMTSGIAKRFDTKVGYPEAMRFLDKAQVNELAQEYLDYIADMDSEALRITDKMPFNYRMLGILALAFPQAKIIHLKRDPLDVCLSCYFVKFKESLSFSYNLVELGHYYRDYERTMAHWRKVLSIPIMEIQYEDLVSDQERQSRALIEFCELPWDDRCLSFHKTDRPILTASSWQVRQPMYTSSVKRWQSYDKYLGPLKKILEAPREWEADEAEGATRTPV